MAAALEDAVRIFELRALVRTLRARLDTSERFATLGRVSAGIAHELSGPAAYIAQNAAALRRELVGVAAYVRRVSRIRPDARVQDQLRELSEIIEDVEVGAEHVRAVSRGLTGQLRGDAPVDHCDVADVVVQVARLVRPELQGRTLLSTLGNALEVRASPLRLTQVLINLVVNAAQALAELERSTPGHIEVRWRLFGDRGADRGGGRRPRASGRAVRVARGRAAHQQAGRLGDRARAAALPGAGRRHGRDAEPPVGPRAGDDRAD